MWQEWQDGKYYMISKSVWCKVVIKTVKTPQLERFHQSYSEGFYFIRQDDTRDIEVEHPPNYLWNVQFIMIIIAEFIFKMVRWCVITNYGHAANSFKHHLWEEQNPAYSPGAHMRSNMVQGWEWQCGARLRGCVHDIGCVHWANVRKKRRQ